MLTDTNNFPFESYLSLDVLTAFWRQHAAASEGPEAELARHIVEQVEAFPELNGPIQDLTILENHQALLRLMLTAIFPAGMENRTYGAAVLPFEFIPFYQTPAFERIRLWESLIDIPESMKSHMVLKRTMAAYNYVLSECTGTKRPYSFTMTIPAVDERDGTERYFKTTLDPRFCTLTIHGETPQLSTEDVERLLANRTDVALWKALLPPEKFEFHGFVVVQALDVTELEVSSLLKRDLLQRDALISDGRIDVLRNRLRALFRAPELQLGLVSMEYGKFDVLKDMLGVGRSLLLSDGQAPECNTAENSIYAQASTATEPVVVYDLDRMEHKTGYEWHLLSQGLRNLVVVPLRFEDQLVGLMELASPNPGDLHELNTSAMLEVADLFATALKRSLDERENRVQAVIKERYTAIHPMVEWRFREAVQRFLQQQAVAAQAGNDEPARPVQMEPILFKNVYPLYGLTDIRGSSMQRNLAIQQDLLDQLGTALNICVEAGTERWLPALDELGYRIANLAQEIADAGLRSGDEVRVLEFLKHEIEPLFGQLETFGPRSRERVQAYRAAIDPELGIVYRKRKAFEDSVALINETVSNYIERQEAQAQAMVPHYFEKYKTDGVDFNIYVGASLVENGDFSPLYLNSLRLWQLMMTCGIVWELDRLKPHLDQPLEATHLILVHSDPLAIRFRNDEKKFDVDGAYNIRYEIVKKRIDKAVVQKTQERLTQPGKIAIVYDQDRDADEYRRYIDYMQAANYLGPEVEDLMLEDLQGVVGLRALRVSVNEKAYEAEDEGAWSPEQLQDATAVWSALQS